MSWTFGAEQAKEIRVASRRVQLSLSLLSPLRLGRRRYSVPQLAEEMGPPLCPLLTASTRDLRSLEPLYLSRAAAAASLVVAASALLLAYSVSVRSQLGRVCPGPPQIDFSANGLCCRSPAYWC